jgi:plastocyanin
MKINVRGWLSGVALASALLLAACGGGSSGGESGGGSLSVTTPGEQLAFQPATLSATAGQQVSVAFKNGSTAQKHNWVLVKGGDDVATQVDEAASAAGEAAGYIPADKANIIANTNLLDGGASGTATFTAPAAGTYTYLCTFPGHYIAGMKGTLTVQ